jgi:hypothetical protein
MISAPPRRGRGKSAASLELISAAYQILAEIKPASIRAVAYQLFNRKLIPDMGRASVARVSRLLVDAREQEMIPWAWVVDETRDVERIATWEDPAAYQGVVIRSYRRDAWAQQRSCVEVWSEKGTVRGTLASILNRYAAPFRVMHGFGSATAIHNVAEQTWADNRVLVVIYVGDWDPSGLFMSAVDIPKRLTAYDAERFHVARVALDSDDVYSGNLPSHPVDTKTGDPRYPWYIERYGDRFWELDALSPVVLRERVERQIVELINQEVWQRTQLVEAAELDSLKTIIGGWKAAQS